MNTKLDKLYMVMDIDKMYVYLYKYIQCFYQINICIINMGLYYEASATINGNSNKQSVLILI